MKDENNADPSDQSNDIPDSDIIFKYKGPVHNRLLGRGIVLESDEYKDRGLDLEDVIPEGDLEIEIIVRKKAADGLQTS